MDRIERTTPKGTAKRPTRVPRRRRRVWRTLLTVLGVLVLVLVGARLALPSFLRSYVNRTIDQSPEYDGRVGRIDVHLWRGAYSIHDLEIVKSTHSVPVPFFSGERVDFSLEWNALLHGAARGKITMEKPRLNFVQGPSPEETQTGVHQPWLQIIEELFPFRIDKAEVIDGEIHFNAFHTDPPIDVFLSQAYATLENLTNIEDRSDPLLATLKARGVAMDSGRLELDMSLDPQSYRPHFDLAARLLDLDVTRLNDLAKAYGGFDFERGRFDLAVEIATRHGFMEGYAKPLFRHVKVVSARDLEDGPIQVVWESLVGAVGQVFKNQPRDQFGTRITLEGDLDNPDTSILEIVGNVLRNAFVRAYLPKVEGRVAPHATARAEPEPDE